MKFCQNRPTAYCGTTCCGFGFKMAITPKKKEKLISFKDIRHSKFHEITIVINNNNNLEKKENTFSYLFKLVLSREIF